MDRDELISELSDITLWLMEQEADSEGRLDCEKMKELIDKMVELVSKMQATVLKKQIKNE